MSILISGMEMPTRCCDCKMYVEDIYYCPLIDREIENPWADDGVELDCPLIPVPPHGRLISAKLLKADFTGNFIEAYPTGLIHAMIDDAPTIIEAEEE